MHAGAQINQSLRSFDQCRQNVGREHIDSEDAWNSGLHLHPPLTITNARIVDYSVEAAELVDLVGNCSCPGAALVDAAGIAGLFNAIDRVADATGAPLEEAKATDTASLRDAIGIDEFDAARARLE